MMIITEEAGIPSFQCVTQGLRTQTYLSWGGILRKNPNLGLYHQEPALQKEQHFLQQLSSQDVASVDLSEHSDSPKEAAVWKRCANGINQFLVNMTSASQCRTT